MPKCKELKMEKLASKINALNSYLVADKNYENAVERLGELMSELCGDRNMNSVVVKSDHGKYLVVLDVEKSTLNNYYLIVVKSITKL